MAFRINAAPAPMAATTAPPSAGPTARARLKPTELRAMAAGSSGLRHQIGHDGLPGGAVHGGAEPQREGQPQQRPGAGGSSERQHAEYGSGGQHQALRYQQQLAAVKKVARGAGGNSEQEHRKIGGGLHQGHQQSRRRQLGHQPGRADVLHPGADVRHNRCDPQPAEPGVEQRGPGAAARRGGGRGQASIVLRAADAFALCRARCAAACRPG